MGGGCPLPLYIGSQITIQMAMTPLLLSDSSPAVLVFDKVSATAKKDRALEDLQVIAKEALYPS